MAYAPPALADEMNGISASEVSAADAGQGAIIVTARRREEDAQTVPVSMSVLGGDTLSHTYTVNINLLTQLVPALNYSSPNPRNTSVTIRGLGSGVAGISQSNDGLEPGIGFYVDQVYHARPATAAFDFTDIDQVEVLRGPQGTLFGKNTTAGAINISSRKPRFDFGGDAEASVGELDFVQAKAAVTGPLIADTLAFRLSGMITRREGVVYNTRYDKKQNDMDNKALRGQLLFKSGNNFSFRLIGDWSSFKGECCVPVYWKVVQTSKAAAQRYVSLANLPAALGGPYTPPSTDVYNRLTDIDETLGVDTSEGGVNGIAEWNIGSATITSVSAWRFWKWDVNNDRDYTGIPIQLTQRIPSRHDQYSQELRIASNERGPVEYVAGLYYLDQKIKGTQNTVYGPAGAYWLLPAGRPTNLLDGYGLQASTEFTSQSYGIFGEVTVRPLPRLAITGGIRYTYEEKNGSYQSATFGGLATTRYSSLWFDQQGILRAQQYTARVSDGSASGRINIAYDLTDDVLVYAVYSRAQKAGGINMAGLPVGANYASLVDPGNPAAPPLLAAAVIRPEKHAVWEAGIKTKALGGALTFNIDAYHVVVKDFQTNVVDNSVNGGGGAALRAYLANIPKVRVQGVEFDAALRLGSHFSLHASGAYTDSKYLDYPGGPCPIEQIASGTAKCNLTGKQLPSTPKWSGSAGGEFALPAPIGRADGDLFLRADVSGKTTVYGDGADSEFLKIPGYAIANASIGYRTPVWEVAVFARNLFDKDYLTAVTAQAGNSGLILANPSDPRIIGLTLRLHS